jgi:hypothetical protein
MTLAVGIRFIEDFNFPEQAFRFEVHFVSLERRELVRVNQYWGIRYY